VKKKRKRKKAQRQPTNKEKNHGKKKNREKSKKTKKKPQKNAKKTKWELSYNTGPLYNNPRACLATFIIQETQERVVRWQKGCPQKRT
jgi:hypothetical protein